MLLLLLLTNRNRSNQERNNLRKSIRAHRMMLLLGKRRLRLM